MTLTAALVQPEVETVLPLTTDETRRLKECERVIQRGLATFYEVGNALAEIRESRLYRISYATFEDYCRERWQMSRFYAHRLIDASQVVDNLLPIGNVPSTESQARELAPFEPEVQKAVWHIALSTAPTDDEGNPVLTAAHIRTVGNVLTEVVKGGGMDDGSGEMKPLGVLIDSAVTEETYERMMRQKEYIKQNGKEKDERRQATNGGKGEIELLAAPETQELLDRYIETLTKFEEETTVPHLRRMFHDHKAHANWQKKRTVTEDCDIIVGIMKDIELASHSGDMNASDLYRWTIDLGYHMGETEYKDRLEYMNRDDVRMALLTDAGDGKQDDRRGKMPGIVCVPWRKVWNQSTKRERDDDED